VLPQLSHELLGIHHASVDDEGVHALAVECAVALDEWFSCDGYDAWDERWYCTCVSVGAWSKPSPE
jgi:hypothetical protein